MDACQLSLPLDVLGYLVQFLNIDTFLVYQMCCKVFKSSTIMWQNLSHLQISDKFIGCPDCPALFRKMTGVRSLRGEIANRWSIRSKTEPAALALDVLGPQLSSISLQEFIKVLSLQRLDRGKLESLDLNSVFYGPELIGILSQDCPKLRRLSMIPNREILILTALHTGHLEEMNLCYGKSPQGLFSLTLSHVKAAVVSNPRLRVLDLDLLDSHYFFNIFVPDDDWSQLSTRVLARLGVPIGSVRLSGQSVWQAAVALSDIDLQQIDQLYRDCHGSSHILVGQRAVALTWAIVTFCRDVHIPEQRESITNWFHASINEIRRLFDVETDRCSNLIFLYLVFWALQKKYTDNGSHCKPTLKEIECLVINGDLKSILCDEKHRDLLGVLACETQPSLENLYGLLSPFLETTNIQIVETKLRYW